MTVTLTGRSPLVQVDSKITFPPDQAAAAATYTASPTLASTLPAMYGNVTVAVAPAETPVTTPTTLSLDNAAAALPSMTATFMASLLSIVFLAFHH